MGPGAAPTPKTPRHEAPGGGPLTPAHGAWQRIERRAGVMLYLRDGAVRDARTRPEHLTGHGTACAGTARSAAATARRRAGAAAVACGNSARTTSNASGSRSPTSCPTAGTPPATGTTGATGRPTRSPSASTRASPTTSASSVPPRTPPANSPTRSRAPPHPSPVAKPDLDGYITRGRALRDGFVQTLEAGGIAPGDSSFPDRFRQALTEPLEAARDAATIDPALRPGNPRPDDIAATAAVREATRVLPATWIECANDTPVQVSKLLKNSPVLGSYDKHNPGGPLIATDATPVTHYGGRGREDDYVDDYFGREYDHNSVKHRPALAVVTRAFQMLFHRFDGPDGPIDLDKYLRDDPEMVDLVIGMLFHYDPPTGGTP